jgi:hypothetical protein
LKDGKIYINVQSHSMHKFVVLNATAASFIAGAEGWQDLHQCAQPEVPSRPHPREPGASLR